ncbi:MAG: ribonuclease PH [Deinococcota bacterium]|jgi:ribonuclease PH|nr:ribonuclease PH [Deinococcota bacterium]
MRQNRQPQSIRPITVTPGYSRHAEGSALVEWGHTKVLATVTIEAKLPPHLRNKKGQKGGWLTAEYALLPRSTQERTQRERLYAGGRTQEIQRLLGRVLRSVTDLTLFANQTLTIDVDVLEADGGTRCAGALAAYAAMHHAAGRLVAAGKLSEWPLLYELGAVSVGVVDGTTLIDLEYSEDVVAEVDLNVVATADGQLVEVQGGGETGPVEAERYVQLVAAGVTAVQDILKTVRPMLR